MIRRKLQDLTLCISYNVTFLHDKAHSYKNFRKQYSISEEIGRGGFGIVYKAERTEDGTPVAVKFVEHRHVRDWTTTCKQLVPTEICLLEMCNGTPGVVRLIDWFANSKGFMIVMERPEEFMDLFDLISIYGCLDETIARSIFVQVVNTVCTLYADHGVLHRDIKDENIIINMRTGEVILVDFGAATIISKTRASRFQGTRSYCPPEWFKRATYMPMEATVWSLGIVLYVMVTGALPFRNEIQICLGRLSIPKNISEECEHLIRRCLVVTPERRADLIEVRQHRWLCKPIATHEASFKCVLDRKLSKRLSKTNRKLKRSTSSTIPSSDDNELFLSDSQTDASIDICERIRRASSAADITVDIHNSSNRTPTLQRCTLEQSITESDQNFRCFSDYDNVSVTTPTEMMHLDCYERAEEPETMRSNDFLVYFNGGQLSRDTTTTTSQYYSANESLAFSRDVSNLSAFGASCSIAEDDSRCFDDESLKGVFKMEYTSENRATTPLLGQQYSSIQQSSVNSTDNHSIKQAFNCSSLDSASENLNASLKRLSTITRKSSGSSSSFKRGISPSLSRYRPLTVKKQTSDENSNRGSTSLNIFRIDSRRRKFERKSNEYTNDDEFSEMSRSHDFPSEMVQS